MSTPEPDDPPAGEAERADPSGGRRARIAALTRPGSARTAHRWGFGAFFLAELVFVLSSVFVAATFGNLGANGDRIGIAVLFTLIVPNLLAGIVGVTATLVRGNGPRLDFGLRWCRSDMRVGFWVGLAGLAMTTIAATLWVQWVGPVDANSAVGNLLGGVRLPPALAVLMFLHVWLVAPLCEEVLYRGLLWGAMERLRWSQAGAFVASTAIFAVAHLEPERTPLLLVIAVPIGVARLLTGRLTASVVAHQMNNFVPAVGLLLVALGMIPA